MISKCKIIIVAVLFFGLIYSSVVGAVEINNNSINNNLYKNKIFINLKEDYTNLTVEEVWNLLSSTSNGIQNAIDVRRDDEWITEHIDTPYPEYAQHWPNLQNGENLNEFMNLYQGQEVIVYCRTGVRSLIAVQLLIENGFTGTIYNMIGGITEWKTQSYPVKPNEAPNKPTINGPTGGSPDIKYTFTFVSNDPDYDDIYLCVNWSDESGEICIGPFASGEEITLSHTWTEKGTYTIKSKTRDKYGNESEEATFNISIPRNKIVTNHFIKIFLDKFLLLERLLNFL